MAVTNQTVTRLPGGVSLRHGEALYVAKADCSAAEAATFDITKLGLKEAPTPVSGIASSTDGAATVGMDSDSTKTSLIAVSSAAATISVVFLGKVGQ
jgi:hypothetical protein